MAINEKITLDARTKNGISKVFALAGESKLAVYVFGKSGDHKNHRLGVEVSPDGDNWFDTSGSITGTGVLCIDLPPALSARIKVFSSEPSLSEAYVHVISQ